MSRITELAEIYVNIHGRLENCSRDDIETDIEELMGDRGYISGGGGQLDGSGSNIDILLYSQEAQAVDQFVAELIDLLQRLDVPAQSNIRVITDAADRRLPVFPATEDKSEA